MLKRAERVRALLACGRLLQELWRRRDMHLGMSARQYVNPVVPAPNGSVNSTEARHPCLKSASRHWQAHAAHLG